MKPLVVPYPPTANTYWRVWRGRAVKSTEARAYQDAVAKLARAAGWRPLDGPVHVRLDVWRPRRIGDLDNTLKVLLDSLKGIAFRDDAQVVAITASRWEDKAHPRAEISVCPAEEVAA
jgi:crossover junction endodeoxyribonuclease RusA